MDSTLTPLRTIAKFKCRSHDTSKNTHIPLLQSHLSVSPNDGPKVVLVGDSMFERMTTTGNSPNLVAPWPSGDMLPDARIAELILSTENQGGGGKTMFGRLDRVFNAGVGGDKIQNVAYRLVGSSSREQGDCLPGLLPLLAGCGTVKLWVVQAGTNNLSPKKGLRDGDVDALKVVIRALLAVGPEEVECRVLVTGLFYRTDVGNELVDKANEKIRRLCELLEDECGGVGRVVYLHPTAAVRTEEHLDDHVHLNLKGYKLWGEVLWMEICSILRSLKDEVEDEKGASALSKASPVHDVVEE